MKWCGDGSRSSDVETLQTSIASLQSKRVKSSEPSPGGEGRVRASYPSRAAAKFVIRSRLLGFVIESSYFKDSSFNFPSACLSVHRVSAFCLTRVWTLALSL